MCIRDRFTPTEEEAHHLETYGEVITKVSSYVKVYIYNKNILQNCKISVNDKGNACFPENEHQVTYLKVTIVFYTKINKN